MAERSTKRTKTGARRSPDGKFLPGTAAGPGRPEGARNAASITLDRIMAEDGEAVARAVIAAARGGDMQAAKLVLDRIQPIRKGRPAPLPLPPVETADGVLKALGAVVVAMSRGELTPDEARTVAAVVAAPRAVLEAQEMERRLLALEEKLARGHRPPQEGEGDEP